MLAIARNRGASASVLSQLVARHREVLFLYVLHTVSLYPTRQHTYWVTILRDPPRKADENLLIFKGQLGGRRFGGATYAGQ